MAEANHSVQQAQVRASMGAAVVALARQRAIKAAKREFQARGLKPTHRVDRMRRHLRCAGLSIVSEKIAGSSRFPWSRRQSVTGPSRLGCQSRDRGRGPRDPD